MPHIPTPSWLLILWCGLIASIASEWIVAAIAAIVRRRPPPRRAVGPQLMSEPRGSVSLAILYGTLIAAPAYGIAFEWLHSADVVVGVSLGALHGIVAGIVVLLAALRSRARERGASLRPTALYRLRRFATRVLFGALVGLLYVVPR